MVRQRPNLEVSIIRGIIDHDNPKIDLKYLNSFESYFSIGVSLVTWFGDDLALQISGMCPNTNRDERDIKFMLGQAEENII